jgi:predicted lactoylglutathione lyase
LPVETRGDVDKLYASAIALGATDEGAPEESMPTFYGGYFHDLDGSKAVFIRCDKLELPEVIGILKLLPTMPLTK